MREHIIVVDNTETNEYFIAPKHSDYGIEHCVPVTYYFPMWVGRNSEILLESAEDVIRFFYDESRTKYVNITNREDIQKLINK